MAFIPLAREKVIEDDVKFDPLRDIILALCDEAYSSNLPEELYELLQAWVYIVGSKYRPRIRSISEPCHSPTAK
jgi:hypothetical protein